MDIFEAAYLFYPDPCERIHWFRVDRRPIRVIKNYAISKTDPYWCGLRVDGTSDTSIGPL